MLRIYCSRKGRWFEVRIVWESEVGPGLILNFRPHGILFPLYFKIWNSETVRREFSIIHTKPGYLSRGREECIYEPFLEFGTATFLFFHPYQCAVLNNFPVKSILSYAWLMQTRDDFELCESIGISFFIWGILPFCSFRNSNYFE